MYGITKAIKFAKAGGTWHKVEEWTEAKSIINYDHWKSWQRCEGGRLYSQCGYMTSYTTTSPDGAFKCCYKLLSCISGSIKFSLNKLNNISDKQFKKLYNRAKKCALYNNLDIKESCFISSSDIHGFYFPNDEKISCIAFCKGEAVLLTNKDVEELL